jgi:hypothetical protein
MKRSRCTSSAEPLAASRQCSALRRICCAFMSLINPLYPQRFRISDIEHLSFDLAAERAVVHFRHMAGGRQAVDQLNDTETVAQTVKNYIAHCKETHHRRLGR